MGLAGLERSLKEPKEPQIGANIREWANEGILATAFKAPWTAYVYTAGLFGQRLARATGGAHCAVAMHARPNR